MRRPCDNCPWRIDAPREHWDPAHFIEIWHNCQDDGYHVMLCHKAARRDVSAPVCQGWVRVLGEDAIGVRLALVRERITVDELRDRGGPALFKSFSEMLRANRVKPPRRNRHERQGGGAT